MPCVVFPCEAGEHIHSESYSNISPFSYDSSDTICVFLSLSLTSHWQSDEKRNLCLWEERVTPYIGLSFERQNSCTNARDVQNQVKLQPLQQYSWKSESHGERDDRKKWSNLKTIQDCIFTCWQVSLMKRKCTFDFTITFVLNFPVTRFGQHCKMLLCKWVILALWLTATIITHAAFQRNKQWLRWKV